MVMRDEFKVGHNYGRSRPPTIVRVEVDLANRKVTVEWELLQTGKELAFGLEHLYDNDGLEVFSIAQTAIGLLEQDEPPCQFVDGDTVEVWQILDGEPRLLATATVSVALCSECARKENPYAN